MKCILAVAENIPTCCFKFNTPFVPGLPKYTKKKELYITQQLKDDTENKNPKDVKLWHGDKETRGVAILISNIYEKDGRNNIVYFYID